jgi:hypothetical protein
MGCSCGSFIHGLPFGGCFVSTGTGAVTDDADADDADTDAGAGFFTTATDFGSAFTGSFASSFICSVFTGENESDDDNDNDTCTVYSSCFLLSLEVGTSVVFVAVGVVNVAIAVGKFCDSISLAELPLGHCYFPHSISVIQLHQVVSLIPLEVQSN